MLTFLATNLYILSINQIDFTFSMTKLHLLLSDQVKATLTNCAYIDQFGLSLSNLNFKMYIAYVSSCGIAQPSHKTNLFVPCTQAQLIKFMFNNLCLF